MTIPNPIHDILLKNFISTFSPLPLSIAFSIHVLGQCNTVGAFTLSSNTSNRSDGRISVSLQTTQTSRLPRCRIQSVVYSYFHLSPRTNDWSKVSKPLHFNQGFFHCYPLLLLFFISPVFSAHALFQTRTLNDWFLPCTGGKSSTNKDWFH